MRFSRSSLTPMFLAFGVVLGMSTFFSPSSFLFADIVLPELPQHVSIDAGIASKYLGTSTPIKVFINKAKVIPSTLQDLGLKFEVNLGQQKADLSIDTATFKTFVKSIKKKSESEPEKPKVIWSKEQGWTLEPSHPGMKLDDKSLDSAVKTLMGQLQKGSAILSFNLKARRINPEVSDAERKTLDGMISSVKKITEAPVELVLDDEKTQMDLSTDPALISFDTGKAELNQEVLTDALDLYAHDHYREPSMVTIKGTKSGRKGQVLAVTEGDFTEGRELSPEEVAKEIAITLSKGKKSVAVPYHEIPVRVFSELENTEYDLLSVGWSDYSTGNHADRVHNFSTALRRVDNTLIESGKIMSLNQTIGSMDGEFVEGLGIFGTAAKPILGGGVCQAATTYYRALLHLGVPITMRKNHSWDLSYYQKGGYGLDATIFPQQGLDVKGVNDIGSTLYFHAFLRPKKLEAYVTVYGKADGRQVTLNPEIVPEKPYRGPKTLKWRQVVTMATGEMREHEIVSRYTK